MRDEPYRPWHDNPSWLLQVQNTAKIRHAIANILEVVDFYELEETRNLAEGHSTRDRLRSVVYELENMIENLDI